MAETGLPKLIVSIEGRLDRLKSDLRTAEGLVQQTTQRMQRKSRFGFGGGMGSGSLGGGFGGAAAGAAAGAGAMGAGERFFARLAMRIAGLTVAISGLDAMARGLADALRAPIRSSAKFDLALRNMSENLQQVVDNIPIIGPGISSLRDVIMKMLGLPTSMDDAAAAKDSARLDRRRQRAETMEDLEADLKFQKKMLDAPSDADRLFIEAQRDEKELHKKIESLSKDLPRGWVNAMKDLASAVIQRQLESNLKDLPKDRPADTRATVETVLGAMKLSGGFQQFGMPKGKAPATEAKQEATNDILNDIKTLLQGGGTALA